MAWIYIEREKFIRMGDKLKLSNTIRESIRLWAPTVSNKNETPRLKLVYRSPNNRYEAWCAGIPNPNSNKGKSGGYRIVYFLDTIEKTINLDFIENRSNLGFKDEGSRKKDAYNDYIRELKDFLKNTN